MKVIGSLLLTLFLGAGLAQGESTPSSPEKKDKTLEALNKEIQRLDTLLEVTKTGEVPSIKHLEPDSLEDRLRILEREEASLEELKDILKRLREQKQIIPIQETEESKVGITQKENTIEMTSPGPEKGKITEDNILDLLRLANALYAQKKYKEALHAYQQVSDTSSAQEDWILFQRGSCLSKLGDIDSAEKSYRKLKKDHPKSFWAVQADWDLKYLLWKKKLGNVPLHPSTRREKSLPFSDTTSPGLQKKGGTGKEGKGVAAKKRSENNE